MFDRVPWPYWVVQRLVVEAERYWDLIDADHISRGVDLEAVPFDRWLRVIKQWFLERLSEEKGEQFLAALNRPPAEATVEEVAESPAWNMESAGSDFMAQLNARGGAGRLTRDGATSVDVGGD